MTILLMTFVDSSWFQGEDLKKLLCMYHSWAEGGDGGPLKLFYDPLKNSNFFENFSTSLGMLGPLAKYFFDSPRK